MTENVLLMSSYFALRDNVYIRISHWNELSRSPNFNGTFLQHMQLLMEQHFSFTFQPWLVHSFLLNTVKINQWRETTYLRKCVQHLLIKQVTDFV